MKAAVPVAAEVVIPETPECPDFGIECCHSEQQLDFRKASLLHLRFDFNYMDGMQYYTRHVVHVS